MNALAESCGWEVATDTGNANEKAVALDSAKIIAYCMTLLTLKSTDLPRHYKLTMPPSQVQIATSSLQRLIKEEASYYKEVDQQKARIARLEKGEEVVEDGNQEFQLKQERKALEETKNVIPSLREKITNAREKLESVLDSAADDEERNKAIEVLKQAKEAQKDDPIG